jgi:hypothetical protein
MAAIRLLDLVEALKDRSHDRIERAVVRFAYQAIERTPLDPKLIRRSATPRRCA